MAINGSLHVQKVRPEPLHVHVLPQLRALILNGEVAPGDPLPETELATMLGVSRGPVREALRDLEREGLVYSAPRRRARVSTLDATDVEEIYSLRRSLETLAAERAASRATPAHFAEMEAVLSKMEAALAAEDLIRLSHLDVEFHDVIYRASAHGRLYRAWEDIRSQVTFFLVSRNVSAETSRSIAIDEHRELLQALVARNAPKLVLLTEQHLLGAYERLSQALVKSQAV
ncbi:GntR family transcriptional regulator [Arthrobacter crystallopoietes BAB-32]|uniref:GntR family transcriptional regulator n=1 Tax=Arthrobacter crystallopoietes BAB-32 TaxID=1246476 RepID=N1VCG2_9MICC|nr:GntR family transcriptional regulator [Arthrobacter crystallopoietes]EMY35983.1 GntR family transcriptional regulator [Arthrobacter crystallopoietes BAB-32]